MKEGGFGLRVGIFCRGSPKILRTIRNWFGRSAINGLTFCATGLYFFLRERSVGRGRGRDEIISKVVESTEGAREEGLSKEKHESKFCEVQEENVEDLDAVSAFRSHADK
jgi:hypothetical protein